MTDSLIASAARRVATIVVIRRGRFDFRARAMERDLEARGFAFVRYFAGV